MYVCICARQAREAADRDLRALLDAARADALWLLERAPEEIDLAAVHRFLEALDQGGR
jgi:hypothetical protein